MSQFASLGSCSYVLQASLWRRFRNGKLTGWRRRRSTRTTSLFGRPEVRYAFDISICALQAVLRGATMS